MEINYYLSYLAPFFFRNFKNKVLTSNNLVNFLIRIQITVKNNNKKESDFNVFKDYEKNT